MSSRRLGLWAILFRREMRCWFSLMGGGGGEARDVCRLWERGRGGRIAIDNQAASG